MQCIVYTRPDNGVDVVWPAPAWLEERGADWRDQLTALAVPKNAVNVTLTNESELPERDPATRHQWRQDAEGRVYIDDTVPPPQPLQAAPPSAEDHLKAMQEQLVAATEALAVAIARIEQLEQKAGLAALEAQLAAR